MLSFRVALLFCLLLFCFAMYFIVLVSMYSCVGVFPLVVLSYVFFLCVFVYECSM